MLKDRLLNDLTIKKITAHAHKWLTDGIDGRIRCLAIDMEVVSSCDAFLLKSCQLDVQQIAQRKWLVDYASRNGIDQLREQAARVWFNRLVAIRYMEVHDYLPCHLRFFSSSNGSSVPQVIEEALNVEIADIDQSHVIQLIQAGDDEALFRYLLVTQCRELGRSMPLMFGSKLDAFDLLLPDRLLGEDGIIDMLVSQIPEQEWLEGVGILSRFYQYFTDDWRDKIGDNLKRGKKISGADVAVATQLFTPDWLAEYIAQNTVSRLWAEVRPVSQVPQDMLYRKAKDNARPMREIAPQEVTVCDLACGSGSILAHAFDLLVCIYEEAGYSRRDAARYVLETNLTGFEIDSCAAAIASFSLTMKALECDNRFLCRGVQPRIVVFEPIEFTESEIADVSALRERRHLLDSLKNFGRYGSLIQPDQRDIDALAEAKLSASPGSALYEKIALADEYCRMLAQTYSCIVSYPPYMARRKIDGEYSAFLAEHYQQSSANVGTAFLERAQQLSGSFGYTAMILSQGWLFLKSYAEMRKQLFESNSVVQLLDVGADGFNNVQAGAMTAIVVVLDASQASLACDFLDVTASPDEASKRRQLLNIVSAEDGLSVFTRGKDFFRQLPAYSLSYRLADSVAKALHVGQPISCISTEIGFVATGNNARFMRLWHEIPFFEIGARWQKYAKGGEFRRWYGNTDHVVYWEGDGAEIKMAQSCAVSERDYREPYISWSGLCSTRLSFRYCSGGVMADKASPSIRVNHFGDWSGTYSIAGFLNSSVTMLLGAVLCPTLNKRESDLRAMPIAEGVQGNSLAAQLAKSSIELSKLDWDSFETSWDFKRHPLL